MKQLTLVLAIGALVLSSVAFAAPQALSSADMDAISAGAGSIESVIGSLPSDVEVDVEGIAIANDYSGAVVGDANNVGLWAAENEGSAVAVGECNTATVINQSHVKDFALIAGDNLQLQADYNDIHGDGYGSNYVIGEGNKTYAVYDDSSVYSEIDDESYGVVAGIAHIDGSFNVEETEIDSLEVDIEDSFNVDTYAMHVSGMEQSTAIVLAAALFDQEIGVNLNVANATVTVGENGDDFETDAPVAEAETFLLQGVFNDSGLEDSDDNFRIED